MAGVSVIAAQSWSDRCNCSILYVHLVVLPRRWQPPPMRASRRMYQRDRRTAIHSRLLNGVLQSAKFQGRRQLRFSNTTTLDVSPTQRSTLGDGTTSIDQRRILTIENVIDGNLQESDSVSREPEKHVTPPTISLIHR